MGEARAIACNYSTQWQQASDDKRGLELWGEREGGGGVWNGVGAAEGR
jgi:hypothetical protein